MGYDGFFRQGRGFEYGIGDGNHQDKGGGEIQTPGIKYGISGRNHQGRGIYRIMNLDTAEKALQCNTDATQCNDVATACNEEIE